MRIEDSLAEAEAIASSIYFQTTPNVLFGAGAASKIAEIVASYGAKRVMLVTDKGVRNAGLTRNAEPHLRKRACRSLCSTT